MKDNERKEMKFHLMVKEVEKRIFYKIDSLKERSIIDSTQFDENYNYANISPFKLIFDNSHANAYIKSIITQVHTAIPYFNSDIWISECSRNGNFSNYRRRLELANIYIDMHSFKRSNARSFVFWSLVGAFASKEDFGKNMSLIVDFIKVLEINENELYDIIHVVKAFFGEEDTDYVFKNEDVYKLFSNALSFLTSK